jgi:methionyl-tRNA synthetase
MNFYVTTSIPYANDQPHLGHAMEFIMADVLARHARERGKPTFFSIGTDEHGGKIAEKAKSQGVEVKEYTDGMSQKFSDLADQLNITNDRFIRTTDPDHETRAKQIWQALGDDIYKGKYVGWYCTGDEAFFTDAVVKANNGICPAHNRPYEKIEEENYFFRLSKYNQPILDAIESDKFRIIPETRKNEIVQVIKDGLEDISISRPKDKISWGIDVPNDEAQVMYVWFEALLNYITVLGYPDGEDFKKFWPANYQVIGKDILRFHAAIWPGILLSLKLPLPENLYGHGFINVNNQKMSKSLGNSIAPSEVIAKYGSDAFRYFFLRHIPSYNDGDFSWQKLHEAYQNELGNELGNGVQRTLVMIQNYLGGELSEVTYDKEVKEQIDKLIYECKFDRALDEIWNLVKSLNQFIDDNKPWNLHKIGESDRLREVLDDQVNQIRNIAILIKPFLPETSEKINNIFASNKLNVPETTLFPRIEEPASA